MRLLRGLKSIIGANAADPTTVPSPSARDEFCAATGMRPMEQTSPGDVFIVGYPRSGNTWMQYLIASAVCGLDVRTAPDALVQDLTPDVQFGKFYKPWFPVTFFKSHFLPRPDYALVKGNPARQGGWMSRHGHVLRPDAKGVSCCPESGLRYRLNGGGQMRCLDLAEEAPLPAELAVGRKTCGEFKQSSPR